MFCASGVSELVLLMAPSAAVYFHPGVPVQTVGPLYPVSGSHTRCIASAVVFLAIFIAVFYIVIGVDLPQIMARFCKKAKKACISHDHEQQNEVGLARMQSIAFASEYTTKTPVKGTALKCQALGVHNACACTNP